MLVWNSPKIIATGYHENYWDGSVLVLQNGDYLAFATYGGPEDPYQSQFGTILQIRSTNGGLSWLTQKKDVFNPTTYIGNNSSYLMHSQIHEEQPVAMQNPDGPIRLMYREWGENANMAGTVGPDIWQIWSTDNGETWIQSSDAEFSSFPFMQNVDEHLFSYVGSQEFGNVTVMYIGKNYGEYRYSVYLVQAYDTGINFSQPIKVSQESQLTYDELITWNEWRNIDPHFTVTCRGFLASYTSPYTADINADINEEPHTALYLFTRRYDWLNNECY